MAMPIFDVKGGRGPLMLYSKNCLLRTCTRGKLGTKG